MAGSVDRRWHTRDLLQIAAFAAIDVLLVLTLSPLTMTLAHLSPVVYALLGSVPIFIPMLARLWMRRLGTAIAVAVIAGLAVMPFSSLGWMTVFALGVPAAMFDLLLPRRGSPAPLRLALAAVGAGVAIWLMSFVVIDPAVVSVWLVVLTAFARLISYVALAFLAAATSRRLLRAGVVPRTARTPQQVPAGQKRLGTASFPRQEFRDSRR